MNRLLQAIGLMRVSEHERIVEQRDNDAYASWNKALNARDHFEDKFKKAITDLAAAREEIAHLDECEKRLDADRNHWRAEANSLRPDALAMRRKRQRDRDRRKGKVNG